MAQRKRNAALYVRVSTDASEPPRDGRSIGAVRFMALQCLPLEGSCQEHSVRCVRFATKRKNPGRCRGCTEQSHQRKGCPVGGGGAGTDDDCVADDCAVGGCGGLRGWTARG